MTLRRQISAQLAAGLARVSAGWQDDRRHAVLHVGPHRTGTTTIQATLNASRCVLLDSVGPDSVGVVVRKDEPQRQLSRLLHNVSSHKMARAGAGQIREATRSVAQALVKHPVTIISDEDFLGPLPARRNIKGLYPFVEETLPHVLAGFRDEGVRVTVAWQLREYSDWMESVYHRRNNLAPERPFDSARFQRRHHLPKGWNDFERRLKRACAGVNVVKMSFEDDARSGCMGGGLFRLAGLSDAAIAQMNHASARHSAPLRNTVSRLSGD